MMMLLLTMNTNDARAGVEDVRRGAFADRMVGWFHWVVKASHRLAAAAVGKKLLMTISAQSLSGWVGWNRAQ